MKDSDPRYVVYARGHKEPDLHSRHYVPIFTDLPYAKAWLDFFMDGEETVRLGNVISLGCGVHLRSDQLDQILSCRQTVDELMDLDTRRILRFKYGTWDECHDKPEPDSTGERSPRIERERRPERPTGYITITELCNASGVLPMHARAALRASGRTKPEYGWAFGPKEVTEIKKLCGMK